MELQLAPRELAATDNWSLAELFVLLGWSSWLVTCCCWAKRWCVRRLQQDSSRNPRGEMMLAGNQKKEEKKVAEVSTQTYLRTPPDSIGPAPHGSTPRAANSEHNVVYSVYSTFRRGNRDKLMDDMVARALPVMEEVRLP